MAATLSINNFWADKALYDDAEKRYYENQSKLANKETGKVKGKKSKNKSSKEVVGQNLLSKVGSCEKENKKKNGKSNNGKGKNEAGAGGGETQLKSSLAGEVAKAREHIKASLESVSNLSGKPAPAADKSCSSGKCEAPALAQALAAVQDMIKSLEKRVAALEVKCSTCAPVQQCGGAKPAASKPAPAPTKADDDDVDLFGSDSEEEDEEALKIKEQRLAEYAAKKSKKTAIIAKSSIVLDVKPWGDDTDMKALEEGVRAIQMDGLLWGASKLAPLAYGIHKLQINCIVEDEKVSVDLLTENIEELTDLVQSVDIAAFNKI